MLKGIMGVAVAVLFSVSAASAAVIEQGGENMSRTEICKQNYRRLFNGEALTDAGNDPEMMKMLQKYIFGEVFAVGSLDIKTREMLTVVSLSAQQALPQLKAHANAALNVGVTPIELRETVYLCAPFVGFPKTLNALGVINEVFAERGIKLPLESQGKTAEEERFAAGSAIQQPLYGNEIKEALAGLPGNMGEDAARFLTEFCFGDIYTRGGLDVKTRELLAIGILVTTGNMQTLQSHIAGSIRAGNSPETVTAAIIQCMPYVGFPNALNALKVLKDTLK
ncbi:MAG: carboxymuconolactone decarboxylase family protein [Alphaproteobacteria bacterium]